VTSAFRRKSTTATSFRLQPGSHEKLEREPRADLDVARVVPILVDEPERRVPRIDVGIPQHSVVQRVDRFDPNLQFQPVRQREVLVEPMITEMRMVIRTCSIASVLEHQRENGGWPKNTDMTTPPDPAVLAAARTRPDSTIDNGVTVVDPAAPPHARLLDVEYPAWESRHSADSRCDESARAMSAGWRWGWAQAQSEK